MNQKRNLLFSLFISFLLLGNFSAQAQCAMCKSNIEMARKDGSTQVGNTLNDGILYLLVLPYAIAGVFGFIYYKKYKAKQLADKLAAQQISTPQEYV